MFAIPKSSIIIDKLCDVLTGALFMIQAYLAYQASESKSRDESWTMIKRCLWIFVAHIVIKIGQVLVTVSAISTIVEERDEAQVSSGNYVIKQGDQEVEFERLHSGPHSDYGTDDEELVLLTIISLFLLVMGIFICLFSCCCLCMFGLYFKYYSSIKDYEHVCELYSA